MSLLKTQTGGFDLGCSPKTFKSRTKLYVKSQYPTTQFLLYQVITARVRALRVTIVVSQRQHVTHHNTVAATGIPLGLPG